MPAYQNYAGISILSHVIAGQAQAILSRLEPGYAKGLILIAWPKVKIRSFDDGKAVFAHIAVLDDCTVTRCRRMVTRAGIQLKEHHCSSLLSRLIQAKQE